MCCHWAPWVVVDMKLMTGLQMLRRTVVLDLSVAMGAYMIRKEGARNLKLWRASEGHARDKGPG